MQFERDLWRRFGRAPRSNPLANAERVELLDLMALRAQASAAGLAVHQADDSVRAVRLLEHALLMREVARRTGDLVALTGAARNAERAVRLAPDERVRVAARIELCACGVLTADLFGDTEAASTADQRICAIEAEENLSIDDQIQLLGLKARLLARQSLTDNDLNGAVEAAGVFDEAVDLSDERLRQLGEGRISAANLRIHRADMLIGFGIQLKEISLLQQAQTDLAQLMGQIDRDRLPITWSRGEALRGAALAACGDLEAREGDISQGAVALSAALAHLPADHSPLDTARIGHALGVVFMTLGEACDDDMLFDEAINAFDRAMGPFESAPELALRAICAYDRASAIARRAELHGDMRALGYAERIFKAELAAINPGVDPVAWAVIQVSLARIYTARAEVSGDETCRANATMALSVALDVFTERGMRTLADVALTGLEHLKARA